MSEESPKTYDWSHLPQPARVTLKELSEALGITKRAVSQALSDKESTVGVSEKTKQRVRSLAGFWNYRPDGMARSLRSRRSQTIGYLETRIEGTSFRGYSMVGGIYKVAHKNDYNVILVEIPEGLDNPREQMPKIFREININGLILSNYNTITPMMQEVISRSNIPVVLLNERQNTNCVFVDDKSGAEEMVNHLASEGYRHLAYITQPNERAAHYSVADRLTGFSNASQANGLRQTVVEDPSLETAFRCIREWKQMKKGPDAIVCSNDYIAANCQRAVYQMDLKIPSDFALCSLSGDVSGAFFVIPPTYMRIPRFDMECTAMEMLLDLIQHNGDPRAANSLRPELIVRASTKRP